MKSVFPLSYCFDTFANTYLANNIMAYFSIMFISLFISANIFSVLIPYYFDYNTFKSILKLESESLPTLFFNLQNCIFVSFCNLYNFRSVFSICTSNLSGLMYNSIKNVSYFLNLVFSGTKRIYMYSII